MKVRTVLFLAVLALVVAFTGAPAIAQESKVELSASVPLPTDFKIVPPDPTVPQKLARYLGKWFGTWDENVLDHILVVEEVTPTGAKVIYAHGVAPVWNINQPRWFRTKGEFVNGVLKLYFSRIQVTVTYRMNEDGTISAVYEGPGADSRVKLRKLE